MASEKRPAAPHRGTDVADKPHLSIEEKYDEVKQLIAIGKEKGYLLYDEVNELLPADITSSDELDDLFSTFGSAGTRCFVNTAIGLIISFWSGPAADPEIVHI